MINQNASQTKIKEWQNFLAQQGFSDVTTFVDCEKQSMVQLCTYPPWADYVFWQYTDGQVGPSALPLDSVGHRDRDVFKGTYKDLVAFWKAQVV